MKTQTTLALVLALTLFLTGCSLRRQALPTPAVTAPPPVTSTGPSFGSGVVASGEIVPANEAQLSYPVSGRVASVHIALGDSVQSGDRLLTLDAAALEAQVAQAEATVATAQANLARLEAGASPAEIADAQSAIDLARAQVHEAQAVKQGAQAQCAVARLGVDSAQAALDASQAQARQLDTGPRAAQLAAAQAEVERTRALLDQAQSAYDRVKGAADIQMRPESLALEQATIASEAARAQYDALFQGATTEERQGAAAQVAAARVQVTQANDQALAACAQIDQAAAAVEGALARQNQSEQRLALLEAGATDEEIAVSQAQVAQAEAALQVARVALDQAVLRAPFAGTVTSLLVSPGETVVPGQVVLLLADLAGLRVETSDLSERDVDQVAPNQKAVVYVEALGQEIEGRVAGIAPQSTTIGGDVVYTVYVDLEEQPGGLRWGMSAEVEIDTE